jgi:hypothetical protein
MTRLRLIPLALAVAAATLTGCTSAPATPASTTVPSPSPTPAATAEEDTAASADAIVVGPVGFEVQDEAGDVLFAASYEDPLADVLAGLEATLGAPPVEGTDEGHIERPPYRTFAWDGFRIGEAGEPARIAFDVLATGDATGGVEVTTPEGIAIGTDAATLEATYPDGFETYPEFSIARGPAVVVDTSRDPARTLSIAVWIDAPATTVTRIAAPVDSWGA